MAALEPSDDELRAALRACVDFAEHDDALPKVTIELARKAYDRFTARPKTPKQAGLRLVSNQ